jgi:MoxR-like ATPase
VTKIYTTDDYVVAPLCKEGTPPLCRVARDRIGIFAKENAPEGEGVDLDKTLEGLKNLEKEVLHQLIGIDEAVHATILALTAGENVFLRSRPGLAKSTLGRLIGEGINGKFFRILLAPDLTRNSLFGSIDPIALQIGEWRRKWDGLAGQNVRVALLDEFGKASPQGQNMMLDALEERRVAEGADDHRIDLLVGIAAANEYPEGFTHSAAFDRFTLRVEMDYPGRADTWRKLLTAPGGREPIKTRVDPEEILLLQGLVEYRSLSLNGKILDTIEQVRKEILKLRNEVSPRRMLAWKRVSVAQAMIDGGTKATVDVKHMCVGRNILWIEPENARKVADIVDSASDPVRGIKIAARADLEEITNQIATTDELQGLARLMAGVKRIKKEMQGISDDPEAAEIAEQASDVMGEIVIKSGSSDKQKSK